MNLVEKNEHGYWTRADQILVDCCVLLSTLNVLEESGKLDEDKAQKIANRFRNIQINEPADMTAIGLALPKTIERITDGEFYGVLVCPHAVSVMHRFGKEYGVENAEKYAFNSQRWDNSWIPLMASCASGFYRSHAVTIIEHDEKNRLYKIIDNGVPVSKEAGDISFVFRILENKPLAERELKIGDALR